MTTFPLYNNLWSREKKIIYIYIKEVRAKATSYPFSRTQGAVVHFDLHWRMSSDARSALKWLSQACWVADSHQPFNLEASSCIFKGISWIIIHFEIHSSNTQSLKSVGVFEIHSGSILKGVSWISHSLWKLYFPGVLLADARRCFKDLTWVSFKSNRWSTKSLQIKLDPIIEETSWIPLKIPHLSLSRYNLDAFDYITWVTYKSTADLRDHFCDPAWVTFRNRGWSKRTFWRLNLGDFVDPREPFDVHPRETLESPI